MNNHSKKAVQVLIFLASTATLGACGWVDSAGSQGGTLTVETPVISGGTLRNAQPLSISEDTAVSVSLTGEGSQLRNWTWTTNNSAETDRCLSINGFDSIHATTTLEDACTDADNCSILVEEFASDTATDFKLTMPQLRAPVAISYNISALRDDGAIVTRQQTLCGISINEAPVAVDDEYVIRRQSAKIVMSTDSDSLLNNDYDDDDVRNSSLKIITTPVRTPQYASEFSLGEDGGFVYQPVTDLPINSEGITEDSFVYQITDGIHIVEATANIKITGSNESPVQIRQIPDLIFSTSNGTDNTHLRQINIAQYFSDPDGDRLSFSLDNESSDSGLSITPEGILQSDAGLASVGQWRASISASDGIESLSSAFVVTMRVSDSLKDFRNNKKPTVTDIKNRTFSGEFAYDVSEFFKDRDSLDQLTFTAVGLPSGLQIRADGVIEGTSNVSNQGRWFIRVTAEDGFGGDVDDGFLLTLN